MWWIPGDSRWQDIEPASEYRPNRPTLLPTPTDTEDIVAWAARHLDFHADPQQARILRSTSSRVILNCTRQWGKSTVTAARAVYEAVTKPGSLILVITPSARQSAEFVRKANTFVQKLGLPLRGDGDNEISIAFPNSSRIVGLPGREETVRGFSAVTLLLVDEAACVDDKMYLTVRPMIAVSGGTVWLMSTPRGKHGFFYDAWTGPGPWDRIAVTAEECPRIRPEILLEDRNLMGESLYRQEYHCEFSDTISGVFDRDLLDRALSPEVQPLRLGIIYPFERNRK